MAVVQMERIEICAMKRDRKKILDLLQRRGTVEVQDLPVADEVFGKDDTSVSRSLLEKNADTAVRAVEVVDKYCGKEKAGLAFLQGRKAISVAEREAFYNRDEVVLRQAQRLVQLGRDIAEANADSLKADGQLEALAPWLELPVPQTYSHTKKAAVFIGSLEGEHTEEDILNRLSAAQPELGPVHVEMVYRSKEITAFYVVALRKDAAKTEEALRAIGFARPASATHHLPAKKRETLLERKRKNDKIIEDAIKEITACADRREDFRMLEDHMRMRAEKYSVIEKLPQSRHVFMLDGYVPARAADGLRRELEDAFECSVELREVGPDEDVPVLLSNNRFTEPTESVLEAYSLPGKGELDPVNVMSIFYYFMFGLMFSDAGYGLIMVLVCGFCLLKFKNMEPNWKKNIRMFFWCGVSTMGWGVAFSSYFGDVVSVVSQTFFGREVVIPPLWFDPLADPMRLLVFCLALGIVHLTVGYILKGVTCAKNHDVKGIFYDAVFPCVVIYPLLIVLMGTTIFEGIGGFMLQLPPVVNTACFAIAGACMLGIVLTGGRESKNWVKRILKGLFALYNTLAGWLSDTLSYSRLLALGLATGVIASVMNQLGAMTAGVPVLGAIAFALIFCAGQALNFGINVLGAYVHSNRLEYVEFFGKFYDGGGRKFAPLGIHTKHFKIEEETHNGN